MSWRLQLARRKGGKMTESGLLADELEDWLLPALRVHGKGYVARLRKACLIALVFRRQGLLIDRLESRGGEESIGLAGAREALATGLRALVSLAETDLPPDQQAAFLADLEAMVELVARRTEVRHG
jgi:hypothetical protein